MRRRRGWKRGDWLVRDEESGFVEYGTKVRRDYYGVLKNKNQYEGPHPQLFVKAGQDPYVQYPQADPAYIYDTSAYNVSAFVYGTNILTPIGPATHLFPEVELGQAQISVELDISMASYDGKSFDFSAQTTQYANFSFSSDGSSLFIFGGVGNLVHQYAVSVPWDVSTAAYSGVLFNPTSQDSNINWGFIKSDGTKMYLGGGINSKIFQYTLGTPYNVSTATYDSVSLDYSSQDLAPIAIYIGKSGQRIYLVGTSPNMTYQYTMSSAWDLSTTAYDSLMFDTSTEDTAPSDISFSADGAKMFIVGNNSSLIHQYTLSTPWNVSTAIYDNITFDPSAQDPFMVSESFKPDGTKMYLGSYAGVIYQYSLTGASTDGIGVWSIGTSFIVN